MDPEAGSIFSAVGSHLEELRARLVALAICFAILFMAGFALSAAFLSYFASLFRPLGVTIAVGSPLDYVSAQVRVASVFAIAALTPVLLWHVLRFILPGLQRREKRWLLLILPFSGLLFLLGIAFSVLLLRLSLWTLATLAAVSGVANIWQLSDLLSLLLMVMLFFGLLFQMPLVALFLGKLGVLSREMLVGRRKAVYFLSFVAAAVITPTTDPFTMTLVALPMIGLFELSAFLLFFVRR